MPSILFVSKPVAPPWNDSSKNLVRDVASHLGRHSATVLTRKGSESGLHGVASEAVYAAQTTEYAPALADNARVLRRLLLGRRNDVWHFFFAPNSKSSAAGRLAARVRRVRTVQTVCSAPAEGANLHAVLFADRVVVLSRHTEQRLLDAGIARERVVRIPPAVGALEERDQAARMATRDQLGLPRERAVVVYPGDLEFSSAAERTLRAHAQLVAEAGSAAAAPWLVIACRAKTARAREAEHALRALVRELKVEDSVSFLGETRAIHDLLATADVVALPAENLYAKMDLPLVLIEAMLLARPTVLAAGTAAAELAEGGAALAIEPTEAAIAQAISTLLRDPALRARLGATARAAALERHDPRAIAARHDALYDELLL